MTRRTLRLAALAAVAVLVLPLAACQTHQGTAAYVGKTRITTDQLDEQVDKFYADPYWAKLAEGQRAFIRNKMVYGMVIGALFKQVAAGAGVTVPQSQLDSIAAEAKKDPTKIQQALQGTFLGSTPEVYAQAFGYFTALQQHAEKSAGSPEEASAKLAELITGAGERYPVELNPRYGSFDSKTLGINLGGEPGVRDLPTTPPPGAEQPQQGEQPPGDPQQGGQPQPQPGEQPPAEQPVPDSEPEPQPSPPAN